MNFIDKNTEQQRMCEVIKTLAIASKDPLNWVYLLEDSIKILLEDVSWIEEK